MLQPLGLHPPLCRASVVLARGLGVGLLYLIDMVMIAERAAREMVFLLYMALLVVLRLHRIAPLLAPRHWPRLPLGTRMLTWRASRQVCAGLFW